MLISCNIGKSHVDFWIFQFYSSFTCLYTTQEVIQECQYCNLDNLTFYFTQKQTSGLPLFIPPPFPPELFCFKITIKASNQIKVKLPQYQFNSSRVLKALKHKLWKMSFSKNILFFSFVWVLLQVCNGNKLSPREVDLVCVTLKCGLQSTACFLDSNCKKVIYCCTNYFIRS